MKIIGGLRREIDIFPNPKFPQNTVGFYTERVRMEKYPEARAAVSCYTICRGAGMKTIALYHSTDLAKQVAEDLQRAYDSGEKEYTLPKEKPPADGE